MAEDLDFSLPARNAPVPHRGKPVLHVLLILVLLLTAANTVLVWRRPPPAAEAGTGSGPMALAAAEGKKLALRLEKQGLHLEAAEAWLDYLRNGPEQEAVPANVWYRIGKQFQDADEHEKALASYYRAEALGVSDDIAHEIGRRAEECLGVLGKVTALRYELAERVGIGEGAAAAGEEIVAEIGPAKITRADLDRTIESEVERQLEQFAAHLPAEQLARQKNEMLRRLSDASERLRFLNQFVVSELLYRRARESGLQDDPDTRAMLRDAEKQILAQRLLSRELAAQIKISTGDLETYYAANLTDYVEPERARISHVLTEDADKAGAVLESLKGGQRFEDLAGAVSIDADTAGKGGAIAEWVMKGAASVPGIGTAPEALGLIFGTAPGEVCATPVKGDKGFHVIKVRERAPERQKPFSEVQQQVYQTLRSRKEREVQEQLLGELRERYDVVIHMGQFQPDAGGEPSSGGSAADK